MKVSLIKKYLIYLFLIFTLFLFTRIDYRITPWGNSSTVDDASYYFHSLTIVNDFDFDYSNQISSSQKNAYFKTINGTFVPKHAVGPGLLSSPFLLLGKFLSGLNINEFFIYSLSPIFYLMISFLMLLQVLNLKFKKDMITYTLIFVGSGILYFAFERFSMSHIYEFFCVTLLIFLSEKFLKNVEKRFSKSLIFLIGLISILSFTVKWINYFIPLVPIYYLLLKKEVSILQKYILKNYFFYLGIFFGVIIFLIHTKIIYGIFTFNPSKVYDPGNKRLESFFNAFINMPFQFFKEVALDTLKITFSFEFGIFYFNPIIFYLVYKIFNSFWKRKFLFGTLLSVLLFFPFLSHILLRTTASSFGFRYLLVLIPIGIVTYFELENNNWINRYLILFSSYAIFAFLFFETTQFATLSENINVFGNNHLYSQPNMFTGVIKSLFYFKSYLIIVFTSYFGVLILKFLFILFPTNKIVSLIISTGYFNSDVERLINYTIDTSLLQLIFLFIFYFLFIKKIKNVYENKI